MNVIKDFYWIKRPACTCEICRGTAHMCPYPFSVNSTIKYAVLSQISYVHIGHWGLIQTYQFIVWFHCALGVGLLYLGAYRKNIPLKIKDYSIFLG